MHLNEKHLYNADKMNWLMSFEVVRLPGSYLAGGWGGTSVLSQHCVGPKNTVLRPWLISFERLIGRSSYVVGGWGPIKLFE
jgi:hypothetical protein